MEFFNILTPKLASRCELVGNHLSPQFYNILEKILDRNLAISQFVATLCSYFLLRHKCFNRRFILIRIKKDWRDYPTSSNELRVQIVHHKCIKFGTLRPLLCCFLVGSLLESESLPTPSQPLTLSLSFSSL
jgi:hypothetical protein